MHGKQKTKAKGTNAKSKISNGTALLPKTKGKVSHTDGRSSWMRRFKDLIVTHQADLGGAEHLSEAERSIIRRCATLTVLLERLELDFALEDQASPFKIDQYQRVANTLKRLLESLGLKRRSKDVTPQSPRDYLRSRVIDHDDDPPRANSHHRVRAAS